LYNKAFDIQVRFGANGEEAPRQFSCFLQEGNYTAETLPHALQHALLDGILTTEQLTGPQKTALQPSVPGTPADGLFFSEDSAGYIHFNNDTNASALQANIEFNSSLDFFRMVGWWPERVDPNTTGGVQTLVAQRSIKQGTQIGGATDRTVDGISSLPNLSGMNFCHVALKNVASGNLVSSNASASSTNVFITVPFHDVPYGAYACVDFAGAIQVGDVNYTTKIGMNDIEVSVLDDGFRTLVVPPNFNVDTNRQNVLPNAIKFYLYSWGLVGRCQ
jgi:hypothetical protein